MIALKLYEPTTEQEQYDSHDPRSLFRPGETITLRDWYERVMLPEIKEWQSSRSIDSDWTALRHWESVFPALDVRQVTREHVKKFAAYLSRRRSPATVNKVWRELRPMLTYAAECGVIDAPPDMGYRRKSKLVREAPPEQREPITVDEVTRIWGACRHATYPDGLPMHPMHYWRAALVLFWLYGPRTLDLFAGLTWGDVRTDSRRLLIRAAKTRKIQGLPLTDIAIRHLDRIRPLRWAQDDRVFRGFNSRGFLADDGSIARRGFGSTWRVEICGAAAIDPPIAFKNFRETAVTRYNAIEPGLGAWIAGHYVPGVTAQHYDYPSERIRAAVESAPVPEVFLD